MSRKNFSRSVAAAAVIAAVSGCSTMTAPQVSAPTVPAAVAVPAGHRVTSMLTGEGMLTYECRANAAGAATPYAWSPPAPDAVLKEKSGAIVGKYYPGPTWELNDGSKITGKQLAVSPATTGIALQLVEAAPASGNGALVGVSYIQRVNTVGGTPQGPCDASKVGEKQVVRYAADYYFFKKS